MRTLRRAAAIVRASGIAALAALVLVAGGCEKRSPDGYAGSSECRDCHERFYEKWATSHHGRAMRPFTTELARAELSPHPEALEIGGARYRADIERGVVVEEKGSSASEYRMVHAMGGKNVFYFLTPMERGHLQVLPVAYDVRKKVWYDTAASAVRHFPDRTDQALHWTDRLYTFNTACHGCHVSQLSRSYDPTDDSYRTTWREPGINCETCHGPAADHVRVCRAAPEGRPPADLRIVSWGEGLTVEQQNDACASCHAKFMPLTESFEPGDRFFDHYDLACLEDPDFHPDGRDLGENYTFTSWRMSPCARSGKLGCLHCHTSSGRYRYKDNAVNEANEACLPCHAERVANAKAHTHHKPEKEGHRCVSCHMPTTQFGGMRRSDHSMLPPTPALTLALKSPNACGICHDDKPPRWADDHVRKWHGDDYQAPVLRRARLVDAARKGSWDRLDEMLACIAGAARDEVLAASMIRLLSSCRDGRKQAAIAGAFVDALRDPSPLVRSSAAAGLEGRMLPRLADEMLKATRDEYLVVRVRAAQSLSRVPESALAGRDLASYRKALGAYLTSLRTRPDLWSSRYNMGNYHMDRGDLARAREEFEAATRLRPDAVPALVNAAMVYARMRRSADAERALRKALKAEPLNAAANFNMGLLQAELGRLSEAEKRLRTALEADPRMAQAALNLGVLLGQRGSAEAFAFLEKACELEPGEPRHAYTYAWFLSQGGRVDKAVGVLRDALDLHPTDAQTLFLAADLLERTGRRERAKEMLGRALGDASLPPGVRDAVEARLRALTGE
ncbi:MAG: tetratricopeptide repeat protein [Planctomycetota bacterium]|jgi:tetratricopeptide (TPR) repeat protein